MKLTWSILCLASLLTLTSCSPTSTQPDASKQDSISDIRIDNIESRKSNWYVVQLVDGNGSSQSFRRQTPSLALEILDESDAPLAILDESFATTVLNAVESSFPANDYPDPFVECNLEYDVEQEVRSLESQINDGVLFAIARHAQSVITGVARITYEGKEQLAKWTLTAPLILDENKWYREVETKVAVIKAEAIQDINVLADAANYLGNTTKELCDTPINPELSNLYKFEPLNTDEEAQKFNEFLAESDTN